MKTGSGIGRKVIRAVRAGDRSWVAAAVCGVTLSVWLLASASCSTIRDAVAPPPRVPLYAVEPEIRVRIGRDVSTARVEGPGKLVVRPVGGGRSRLMSSPLQVRNGIGGLEFTDGRERFVMGFGIGAEVAGYEQGAGDSGLSRTMLRVDGVEHPGFAVFHSRSDEGPEKFDVIVAMPVEDYLPGVVVGEMYAHWPRRAFEVQAVCARTYALHERDRARRLGRAFDVESTTLDQAFGGTTTILAAKDAVRDTRGVVLTERGELVRAYYSSCCGGRAAAASDVWPTGPGFEFNRATALQGRPREWACEPSTMFRWSVTRSESDFSQRLRAWGRAAGNPVKTMGQLRSVEIDRTSASGRPARYRLTDDKGKSYTLTAEEFRVACNQPVDGLAPITRENRVSSGDVSVEVRSGVVKVSGRGFGHGVGMCQWCAKGMAERGESWQKMVAAFYPGAEAVRVY